jgi:hypothetical protein
MKSLKNVFASFSLFLLVLNTTFANDPTGIKKPEVNQIHSLLKNIEYSKFLEKETKLNISFFVNHQSEIIVVSTNHKELDSVIKATLNYKKLALDKLKFNEVYTIPVVIK